MTTWKLKPKFFLFKKNSQFLSLFFLHSFTTCFPRVMTSACRRFCLTLPNYIQLCECECVYVCVHVLVCVSGGRKYVIKCVPIKKKKKHMCKSTCEQSRRKRITYRETIKKVVREWRKRDRQKKERSTAKLQIRQRKKDKKGYKGTGNEECNGDENGQKSEGEETREGGDRKGSRVNGVNTHRSVQQSGLVARSNIKNF